MGIGDEMENRTALVTGASGGIGRSIVRTLGEAGYNVIAHWGKNRSDAEEAVDSIPEGRKLLVQADFADGASVDALWRTAVGWKGSVDVVVNNAAVMPEAAIDASDAAWEDSWSEALAINVVNPAALLRHATKHFCEHGGGVLITLSSLVSQIGAQTTDLIAYAASKAAITAATRTIAASFARENVLAYCIAPGPVDTEMTARAAQRQGGLEAMADLLPIGELIPTDQIAEIVEFLASGSARHLTGATLDVNGALNTR